MYGCNALAIAGQQLLLVDGQSTHLVRETNAGGRAAIEHTDPYPVPKEYDDSVYKEIWAHKTICGKPWVLMAPGEGPKLYDWQEPVFAPSCKACNNIISKTLKSTEPDDRIDLISKMAMECVNRCGSSTIFHVPGDQIEHLRKALRIALKKNNLKGYTYATTLTVIVGSTQAYEAIPQKETEARHRRMMERMNDHWEGREMRPLDPRDEHQIDWQLWGT